MLFTPVRRKRNTGLGAFEIGPLPGLSESIDNYFKENPIDIDFKGWFDGLSEEEKAAIDARAEEIKKEMDAGTYTSSTYNPTNTTTSTPTTSKPISTTSSNTTTTNTSTTKQNSVATTTNTANTASPKTAESKKWIPGLENWQTGAIAGLAAISLVTVVVIATSSDDKKKKKKKRK